MPLRTARRSASEAGPARFLLRLPPALHAELAERARAEGLSLNEYCVRCLWAGGLSAGPGLDVRGLAARARRVVGEHFVGLIVHGSMARGEPSTSSDVDVLVVVDRALSLTRDLYRQWDAEQGETSGVLLDVHFVQLPESADRAGSVWCEAAIEGTVLADDTEGRVARTLRDVRRTIGEGRLVRKRAHGQPYWTAA